jgi:hypothetical protein
LKIRRKKHGKNYKKEVDIIMKQEKHTYCIRIMGGLSNFDGVASYFSDKGYKIVIPDLPIYLKVFKTNVKSFAKYVKTLSLSKVLIE